MKKTTIALLAAALALPAVSAHASALSRTDRQIVYIFEKGNYAEIGAGFVTPKIEGTDTLADKPTGNIANDFGAGAAAVKFQLNDNFSLSLGYDRPFGIDVEYSDYAPNTGVPTNKMEANALVQSLIGLAAYRTDNNFWIYGGPALYKVDGSVTIPNLGYRLSIPSKYGWGYVAGLAYEYPEIALRADLTYYSPAKKTIRANEQSDILGRDATTDLTVRMPSAVNFNFKTGIAPKTLLSFGVSWVNWKKFALKPELYKEALGIDLVNFKKDAFYYQLGIGRQLTDKLGGQISLLYDTGTGSPVTPLGPTNEFWGIQAGGKYALTKNVSLTAGARYLWYKDETTYSEASGNLGKFSGHRVFGIAGKIGVNF